LEVAGLFKAWHSLTARWHFRTLTIEFFHCLSSDPILPIAVKCHYLDNHRTGANYKADADNGG